MERLDKIISKKLNISRANSKKIIENGYVKIGEELKTKTNSNIGKEDLENIKVSEKYIEFLEKKEEKIISDEEKEKVKILYEDEYIYIINKPAGIITESDFSKENTLVDILKAKKINLNKANKRSRDGIVHRLDKDTSGLLIITKTNEANIAFSKMFKEKKITKKYICIVKGVLEKDNAAIDMPIKRDNKVRTKMTLEKGGKEAFTRFKVLKRYKDTTLLEVRIYTGRTHQIRIHMAGINHPVLGDVKYGNLKNKYGAKRQMLHSESLIFIHPFLNKKMEFKAELPQDFMEVIKRIEENE